MFQMHLKLNSNPLASIIRIRMADKVIKKDIFTYQIEGSHCAYPLVEARD